VTPDGTVFVMGQASRPAPFETVLAQRLQLVLDVIARRAPSFRLTGGSGRFSDPQPSFHQVTDRGAWRPGFLGTRQPDRARRPFHLSPVIFHGSRRSKKPTFILFIHRLLFLPIDLLPIDTDGSPENVTFLQTFLLTHQGESW